MINLNSLKELAKQGTQRQGNFILKCGHKNGYQMSLYPFEWVCIECNQKYLTVLKEGII